MGEADERKDEFMGALAALGGSAGNGRGDSMTLINRSSGVQAGAPSMPTSRRARTPREATTANSFDKAIRTIDDCLRKEAGCGTVLDYTDEPLVSSDFNHYPASSTVDSLETSVMEGKLARVVSWYDNEWGFSNRMIDTAGVMAKFL